MSDCLVIGGGILGLMSALFLSHSGRQVHVVDDDDPSASSAGAGVLSPLPPWRYSPAIIDLTTAGLAAYPDILDVIGDHCHWRQIGMVVLPPHDTIHLQQWRKDRDDIKDIRITDMVPALQTPFKDALFLPTVQQLHSPQLLNALRQSLGEENRTIATVTALEINNHRISRVFLEDGNTLSADIIVLSAGAWSGRLCPPPKPQIKPCRGQILLYSLLTTSLNHVVLSEFDNFYLVPRPNNTLLAGSTSENVGFAQYTTLEGVAQLHHQAQSFLPALAQPLHSWAGLRPESASGLPIISRHPTVENLFLNTGHFRYGVTMAPASAQQLLGIMDGTIQDDENPYRWEKSAS